MATAACHLAQTDHFLRIARTPPPTRRPCATLPRPQSLMRRRSAIPAGASRKPAAFAADGPRTSTDYRPLPRPVIPANACTPQYQHTITSCAAFPFKQSNFATFRRRPARPTA